MEVFPGIYQLRMPFPDKQPDTVNAYLVKGTNDWLLVDTGWKTRESAKTASMVISSNPDPATTAALFSGTFEIPLVISVSPFLHIYKDFISELLQLKLWIFLFLTVSTKPGSKNRLT